MLLSKPNIVKVTPEISYFHYLKKQLFSIKASKKTIHLHLETEVLMVSVPISRGISCGVLFIGYFDPHNTVTHTTNDKVRIELTARSATLHSMISAPALRFSPKYQLGHPEQYSFSLSKKTFSRSNSVLPF